jgi:hypothetical protein
MGYRRAEMQTRASDDADYRFFSAPNAAVRIRLAADDQGQLELRVFGNRAGLLSLANVLLWFVANAWRREFLSLAELPFVQAEAPLSVCLRLTDADATGRDGVLSRTDHGEQFEWAIPEDDLKRVALLVHRLVSNPGHEYDRLMMAEGSATGVHVRMVNTAE